MTVAPVTALGLPRGTVRAPGHTPGGRASEHTVRLPDLPLYQKLNDVAAGGRAGQQRLEADRKPGRCIKQCSRAEGSVRLEPATFGGDPQTPKYENHRPSSQKNSYMKICPAVLFFRGHRFLKFSIYG